MNTDSIEYTSTVVRIYAASSCAIRVRIRSKQVRTTCHGTSAATSCSLEHAMITKEQIRRTRRAVAGMQPPVLSIYLQIDQANPHEARVRARSTMAALGVPDEIQRRAMSALDRPENHSPTLAIFANETQLDVVNLPFELPVIDPRTGRVEARWGEPYSAPLLLALDQHERFAVVLIARDRCRTFEVYLGEIEELSSGVRPETPGADVRPENRQSFPAFIPSRNDAARD